MLPDSRSPLPTARSVLPTTSVLVVVVAAILYVCPLLLDAPLTDPDEGLHAAIAQEMHERGDLVVPRFLGTPFLDKPALYFWAQVVSMTVFGMSTAAARLPGMLFAVLGVVTTAWVARVLFNSALAWMAAACYATMALPFLLAQAPVHDMALVPLTYLALGLLWKSQSPNSKSQGVARETRIPDPGSRFSTPAPRRPGRTVRFAASGAAGVTLGLSILTKGFEGVAIVGLAFGTYLVLSRAVTWRVVGQGLAVVAIALAVAAPWFLAMEARTPGYLQYYFVGRHLLGFATDTQRHGGQPWWFYVPLVAGGALPWLPYVRFSNDRGSNDQPAGSPTTMLWTWLIATVAFFSLSGSKAVTYVLPAMPAVAILAARGWVALLPSDATDRKPSRNALKMRIAFHVMLFAVIALAAPWGGSRFAGREVTAIEVVAFSAVALAWAWLLWMLWRRPPAWVWPRLVAATAATYAVGFAMLGPPLAQSHSARDLATYFNALPRLPATIFVMDQRVSFIYYLRPDVRARIAAEGVRSVSVEQLAAMNPFPRDAAVTIPADLARRLLRVRALADTPRQAIGRYVVVSLEKEFEVPISSAQAGVSEEQR